VRAEVAWHDGYDDGTAKQKEAVVSANIIVIDAAERNATAQLLTLLE
jgi:hypothetical protein